MNLADFRGLLDEIQFGINLLGYWLSDEGLPDDASEDMVAAYAWLKENFS